jgi:mono/diheme cytochrome c family protein
VVAGWLFGEGQQMDMEFGARPWGWPAPLRRWAVLSCLGLLASSLVGESPTAVLPATPRLVEPPLEQVMAGRYVFERQCVVCHGKWGDGTRAGVV